MTSTSSSRKTYCACLPVLRNADLRIGEVELAVAHESLQVDLQYVLHLGAVLALPRLQREVRELARVTPEGERHNMVEFVVANPRCIDAGLLHELSLHSVGVARGRAHGLGVAGYTNRLIDRVLVHIRIERDATVRRLDARSVLRI